MNPVQWTPMAKKWARLRRAGPILVAAGLAAAQLVLAAGVVTAAKPATLVVTADQPAAVPAGHNWSFDDFFPRTLTVHNGMTVGFAIEGFHSATLLPKGTTAASDEVANGLVAADLEDTALNPNGTTHTLNAIPNVLPIPSSGCGTAAKPCHFNGNSVVSSGVPFGPPSGPFFVKIDAAPGTYVFHCRVHIKMTGTLKVVGNSHAATTPAQLTSAAAAQVAADVAAGHTAENAANASGTTKNADGTTTWTLSAGTSSPDGTTVILEMLPRNVNIKSGDTVKWVARGINEIHTVTFPTELHTDIVPVCEAGAADTPATPTVIPPTGPFDFTCGGPPVELENGGGNGATIVTKPSTVSDSGIIADSGEAAGWGVPATSFSMTTKVKFTGAIAGTYHYLCQVHDGMVGTITIGHAAAPPATSTASSTSSGTSGLDLWAAVLLAVGLAGLGIGWLAARRRVNG